MERKRKIDFLRIHDFSPGRNSAVSTERDDA